MDDELVEMAVESVRVHMLSNRHVVILKETDRDRYLPIWIGPWEASAIAMKLQGLTPERPLTHDLFATTLDELGVRDRPGRSSPSWPTRPSTPGSCSERRRATVEVDARPVRRARAGRPGGRPDLRRDRRPRAGRPGRRRRARRRGRRKARRSSRSGRGSSTRGSTSSATSSTRSTRGPARAEGRAASSLRPRQDRARRAGARRRAVRPQPRGAAARSRARREARPRLGARRRAGRPRVVRHADLGDRAPRGLQLDQQLGREERAARLDPHAARAPRAEELAGAVDVAHPQAEEDPVGKPVGAGVERSGRAGPPA